MFFVAGRNASTNPVRSARNSFFRAVTLEQVITIAGRGIRAIRSASNDIDLGSNIPYSSFCNDGDTIWRIVAGTGTTASVAQAHNLSTGARDSTKDITLLAPTGGNARLFTGGLYDGTRIYFIEPGANLDHTANTYTGYARAWIASTRTRDAENDIELGNGPWLRGGYHDGTIWFLFTQRGGVARLPGTPTNDGLRAYSQPESKTRYSIYIGTQRMGRVFIGNTEYNAIYRGDELIWRK